MKKFIICFFILISFIIPINVSAVTINGIKIIGKEEAIKGDYVDLKFIVSENGLKAGTNQTLGIEYVLFRIEYDTDDLKLTELNSDKFKVELIKIGDDLYILGTTKEGIGSNMCALNLLYCGDVEISTKFYVSNTTKESYEIKIDSPSLYLLNIIEDRNYNFDDLDIIQSDKSYIHTLNILKGTNKKTTKPKKILEVSKENVISNKSLEKNVTSNPNKAIVKSDNNYLKSLEIKDHEIAFDKEKNIYKINISDKIELIEVDAKVEDSKATYEVVGDSDFKENDNKIYINVTSESGKVRTYTIEVKIKEAKDEYVEEEMGNDNLSNRLFGYAKIGGIGLSIFILIFVVVGKIKDRKINKFIDKI